MRTAYLTMIVLLCCSLEAHEQSKHVHTEGAVYEGKKIVLTGDVSLQHSLGKISAHCLTYIPGADKESPSNSNALEISEDVKILLRGGGELRCQKATIDYAQMRGNFLGNSEFPDVAFRNSAERETTLDAVGVPVEVKSTQMIMHLTSEPGCDPAQKLVNEIEAVQNVRIAYDSDNLLVADHALYQRLSNPETSAAGGRLTLSVQDNHPFCQLTNTNGDCLHAKTIQADTADRKLWMAEPEGKLLLREEKEALQTLEFKSDELSWDNPKEILVLKGHVEITQNGNLHIKTAHEISIAQSSLNGKRRLLSIRSPEKTELLYIDALKGQNPRIYCPGSLTIDHRQQHMTLQGIFDYSDPKEASEQVLIEDVLGEMYADLVRIDYCWTENQFVPKKVILEGNVRLLNRFDGHVEEVGSVLHYALADRIDYSPEQKEMLLSGSDNDRVLIFDKVNNVQMSAPSLKIRRDSLSQKDIIKGMGDVRFTFLEKELARFKQQFKQKNDSHEGADHGK